MAFDPFTPSLYGKKLYGRGLYSASLYAVNLDAVADINFDADGGLVRGILFSTSADVAFDGLGKPTTSLNMFSGDCDIIFDGGGDPYFGPHWNGIGNPIIDWIDGVNPPLDWIDVINPPLEWAGKVNEGSNWVPASNPGLKWVGDVGTDDIRHAEGGNCCCNKCRSWSKVNA